MIEQIKKLGSIKIFVKSLPHKYREFRESLIHFVMLFEMEHLENSPTTTRIDMSYRLITIDSFRGRFSFKN